MDIGHSVNDGQLDNEHSVNGHRTFCQSTLDILSLLDNWTMNILSMDIGHSVNGYWTFCQSTFCQWTLNILSINIGHSLNRRSVNGQSVNGRPINGRSIRARGSRVLLKLAKEAWINFMLIT